MWVGLERPRAERVQEGRRRVRPQERGRRGQGRRRHQRRQDHRGAPRRQLARRRQLVHVVERRHLLPVRRLDRPGPVHEEGRDQDEHFPAATMYYTQYKGKRCALPLLADAYGFYYNKALFKAAGMKGPPKTLTQLTHVREEADDEERRRVAEGRRLQPVLRLLPEHVRRLSADRERQVVRRERQVDRSASDPAWAKLLRWQKSLVDYYGHKNLVKWNAGAGDEFSASHAFETGKLAMMIDGEWRVSFIAAEHPELQVRHRADARRRREQLGLRFRLHQRDDHRHPKNAKNKDASWALVKYLTTNDHALAQFSNGIRNVPSTKSAAKSKELKPDRTSTPSPSSSRTRSRRPRRSRRPGRRTSTRSRTSSRSGSPGRSATCSRACRRSTSRSTPS